ncbi:MAG: NAD(P)H-binding protein, partial [Ensifer adhaerens]
MSERPILVTGATGKLGRLVVERLLARGQPVRVFTRRPETARALFGEAVQIAAGDFGDRAALDAAVRGVGRLLLLSPISTRLVTDQVAVADAAVAANVARIVKISGSDWTIEPPGNSISGEAHAAVERHL